MEVGQDRSASSYRIRITHVRLDARLGNSSRCPLSMCNLFPAAEYVAPARAITYAHAAPAVEYVTSAPTVAHGTSPVAYTAQEASFQLPQEIVYEQPAFAYEANGSQPVEYAQPLAPIDVCSPRSDARNTTYSHDPESAEDCGGTADPVR